MVETFMVKLSRQGPSVNLATQAGANAYLVDGKIDEKQLWKEANQLRQTKMILRRNKCHNPKLQKKLDAIYSVWMYVAMNADVPRFREQFSDDKDIQQWILHGQWVLREMEDAHFTRNNLQFLQSLVGLMRHPLPVTMVLYENLELLESLGKLFARAHHHCSISSSSEMYYAQCGVRMVDNLLVCATRDFDNCWKPKRVFFRLNSIGLLDLYLIWAADPQTGNCQLKTNTLDMLQNQCSARFVKKIFQDGTPCGDIVRRLLQDPSSVCKTVLPYYVDLIQIADAPTKKNKKKTPETCICQHCQKCNVWEKMARCGQWTVRNDLLLLQEMPKSRLETSQTKLHLVRLILIHPPSCVLPFVQSNCNFLVQCNTVIT